MTPERINDDDMLTNLETSLLETIETATAELEAVRTVQRLARAGRSGRPRGSKNRPRVVSADDVEESASTRNVKANQVEASEEDETLHPNDMDAAP